jgi:hypothetical protein
MYTLSQTARVNPSKKTARPMPCNHGLFVVPACPLKPLPRSKRRTTRMIPTRMPANRTHLVWPALAPVDATSQ